MNLKYELQNIISGISGDSTENPIQAAAYHLRESQKAGGNIEKTKFTKEQETEKLTAWISDNKFWFTDHDERRFIARGAEQRVYIHNPINRHFFYLPIPE